MLHSFSVPKINPPHYQKKKKKIILQLQPSSTENCILFSRGKRKENNFPPEKTVTTKRDFAFPPNPMLGFRLPLPLRCHHHHHHHHQPSLPNSIAPKPFYPPIPPLPQSLSRTVPGSRSSFPVNSGLSLPVFSSSSEDELDVELGRLLALLPEEMRRRVSDHPELPQLIEVVMDLGRKPLARFPSGDFVIAEHPITVQDIEHATAQVLEVWNTMPKTC
jgi:hypothetical protein